MADKILEEILREAHERKAAEQITCVPIAQPTWLPCQEPKTEPSPLVQWQPAKAPAYKWDKPRHH